MDNLAYGYGFLFHLNKRFHQACYLPVCDVIALSDVLMFFLPRIRRRKLIGKFIKEGN